MLFIDARKLGIMIDRRHRELNQEDVKKISDTYHAWRGEPINGQTVEYRDIAGFCKTVKLEEIRKQTHILTPGRFVGNEEEVDDLEEFEEKMRRLTNELAKQMNQSRLLDEEITRNLERIGYDF